MSDLKALPIWLQNEHKHLNQFFTKQKRMIHDNDCAHTPRTEEEQLKRRFIKSHGLAQSSIIFAVI
jgi:hypothetical protein